MLVSQARSPARGDVCVGSSSTSTAREMIIESNAATNENYAIGDEMSNINHSVDDVSKNNSHQNNGSGMKNDNNHNNSSSNGNNSSSNGDGSGDSEGSSGEEDNNSNSSSGSSSGSDDSGANNTISNDSNDEPGSDAELMTEENNNNVQQLNEENIARLNSQRQEKIPHAHINNMLGNEEQRLVIAGEDGNNISELEGEVPQQLYQQEHEEPDDEFDEHNENENNIDADDVDVLGNSLACSHLSDTLPGDFIAALLPEKLDENEHEQKNHQQRNHLSGTQQSSSATAMRSPTGAAKFNKSAMRSPMNSVFADGLVNGNNDKTQSIAGYLDKLNSGKNGDKSSCDFLNNTGVEATASHLTESTMAPSMRTNNSCNSENTNELLNLSNFDNHTLSSEMFNTPNTHHMSSSRSADLNGYDSDGFLSSCYYTPGDVPNDGITINAQQLYLNDISAELEKINFEQDREGCRNNMLEAISSCCAENDENNVEIYENNVEIDNDAVHPGNSAGHSPTGESDASCNSDENVRNQARSNSLLINNDHNNNQPNDNQSFVENDDNLTEPNDSPINMNDESFVSDSYNMSTFCAENNLNDEEETDDVLMELTDKFRKGMDLRRDCAVDWLDGIFDFDYSIDDFDVGRLLGRGKFGNVYLARDRFTNYIVALKIMHKSQLKKHRVVENLRREILIQTHLRHHNVLRLYTYFHDEEKVYLVLEACNKGELYSTLSKFKKLPEHVAANYFRQMCRAIDACHQKSIIHRDIKPENILISKHPEDGSDVLKLADFGWSVHLASPEDRRLTLCGTLDYLSPEMVRKERHQFGVDIWALGILLYEFLCGHPPFERRATIEHDETQRTFSSIIQDDVFFSDDEDDHFSEGEEENRGGKTRTGKISDNAKDLISRFLAKNANDRISLSEALKHPWLSEDFPEQV